MCGRPDIVSLDYVLQHSVVKPFAQPRVSICSSRVHQAIEKTSAVLQQPNDSAHSGALDA